MIDYKQLAAAAHANATDKGFWEGGPNAPYQRQTKLALIHSELSEALDCLRRHQIAAFEDADGKPCGLGSELADVVLRCFGFGEAYELDVMPRPMEYDPESRSLYDLGGGFAAAHICVSHGYVVAEDLQAVVERCFDTANAFGIDLDACLLQKHAYNLTRAVKHGGKAF
jgi:hypothetical protein